MWSGLAQLLTNSIWLLTSGLEYDQKDQSLMKNNVLNWVKIFFLRLRRRDESASII